MSSNGEHTSKEALGGRLELFMAGLARSTEELLPDRHRTDVHVHLGIDAGSGMEMTLDAIEGQLDMAGVDRAVLIPLKQSDGYHVTSGRLAELCARSDGRFRFFYRVDPRDPELRRHVAEGLEAGAVGLKLHPRGDSFSVLDDRVQAAVAMCADARRIVIVHCGMDMDGATTDVLELARLHPNAWFLLGHLAADALSTVAEATKSLPNVLMCTGWWGSVDMAWASAWIDSRRFVFGSDPPYGSIPLGAYVTSHTFAAAGMNESQLGCVFGGNLDAVLEGSLEIDEPLRTRADSDANLLARIPAGFQRAYLALQGAGGLAEEGNPLATRYLELAQCALEPNVVDGLRDEARELSDTIDLAIDLNEAGMDQECYRVTAAALVQAACLPILARR